MTLIVDRPGDGPQVHVLAIGVGAYRHLPGGAEQVGHDTLGLRQLSGPPHSVVAFVDWVVNRMRHPTATLGSVELLVSPATGYGEPGGAPVVTEVPSYGNVEAAFDRWKARCDTDPGNVAVLYFCGHGVERESQFLLLEDFGASAGRLLERAIDIGNLYLAMADCAARSQYFFVDACREIPFQLMERLSGNARQLLDPKLVGDQRTDTALLFATSGGAKAYGRPGQATRFTQALIQALDGLGGRTDGARWVVDMPSLQRAVTQLLCSGSDGAPAQQPTVRGAGSGPFHVIAEPPIVPVVVACEPAAAIPDARAALSGFTTPEIPLPELVTDAAGWSFEVPADQYLLTIGFPSGGYQPVRARLYAWPPGVNTRVVVSP